MPAEPHATAAIQRIAYPWYVSAELWSALERIATERVAEFARAVRPFDDAAWAALRAKLSAGTDVRDLSSFLVRVRFEAQVGGVSFPVFAAADGTPMRRPQGAPNLDEAACRAALSAVNADLARVRARLAVANAVDTVFGEQKRRGQERARLAEERLANLERQTEAGAVDVGRRLDEARRLRAQIEASEAAMAVRSRAIAAAYDEAGALDGELLRLRRERQRAADSSVRLFLADPLAGRGDAPSARSPGADREGRIAEGLARMKETIATMERLTAENTAAASAVAQQREALSAALGAASELAHAMKTAVAAYADLDDSAVRRARADFERDAAAKGADVPLVRSRLERDAAWHLTEQSAHPGKRAAAARLEALRRRAALAAAAVRDARGVS